jgi:hypothetical protein
MEELWELEEEDFLLPDSSCGEWISVRMRRGRTGNQMEGAEPQQPFSSICDLATKFA